MPIPEKLIGAPMVRTETPVCDFGQPAPDFFLPGTDGKHYRLRDVRGPNGLLVMFICNHCPYVQAIRDRLIRDAHDLQAQGIRSVAIMSNDPSDYPEDSFENMRKTAESLEFPFPYLYDETQEVAKVYGAVCTPVPNAQRDLFEAMKQVAQTGNGPKDQIPSMGCSIKWKLETT